MRPAACDSDATSLATVSAFEASEPPPPPLLSPNRALLLPAPPAATAALPAERRVERIPAAALPPPDAAGFDEAGRDLPVNPGVGPAAAETAPSFPYTCKYAK